MTREEARKKLSRIIGGKTVRLEVEHWGKGVSSPDRRAAADAAWQQTSAALEETKAAYWRIIHAHPELQRLGALEKKLREEKERLNHERHYRKFQALKPSGGIGWEYIGSGDTWEEVIEKAESKKEVGMLVSR